MIKRLSIAAAILGAATAPAFAHLNPVEHGSFAAGFTHPISGLDHILAMVAVGLWAAMLGGRALYAVPATFVSVMALGFLAALAGLPLPFVEPTILASVVVLGAIVALAVPVPTWIGMVVVGFFSFFHGHAHGGEIGAAGMAAYGAGFAVATAILHAVGIGLGIGLGRAFGDRPGTVIARIAGGLTALGGIYLVMAG